MQPRWQKSSSESLQLQFLDGETAARQPQYHKQQSRRNARTAEAASSASSPAQNSAIGRLVRPGAFADASAALYLDHTCSSSSFVDYLIYYNTQAGCDGHRSRQHIIIPVNGHEIAQNEGSDST